MVGVAIVSGSEGWWTAGRAVRGGVLRAAAGGAVGVVWVWWECCVSDEFVVASAYGVRNADEWAEAALREETSR